MSLRITTHVNSALCREVQRNCSFHEPVPSEGDAPRPCPSCDSLDHVDNSDPRCPFYLRERDPHIDAAATGSAAPDMFERSRVSIERHAHEVIVTIHSDAGSGDKVFVKSSACGDDNNCLIDTLRQAIAMHFRIAVHIGWIREQLQLRFPKSCLYPVTRRNFLDLRNHWEAVVDLILESARAQGCNLPDYLSAASFQVVCVEENARVIGDRVGSGPVLLHILNEGFLYYVPLIRRRF